MTDNELDGKLVESCNDCDFVASWDGGPVSDDPGLGHALDTGHTVTGTTRKRYLSTGSDPDD